MNMVSQSYIEVRRLGGDRNAETPVRDTKASSSATVKEEDFRQFSEIFKPCTSDNAYLPSFSLLKNDQRSARSYKADSATVSFDEAGNARIYDNCKEVFHYGPNEKETFVWTSGKNGATLSEIHLANEEKIKFNPFSQTWRVFDAQGQVKGEQRFHCAVFTVKGVDITLPLEGAISPERLHREYKKLQSTFENGETQGLVPFSSDEFGAVQNDLKAREAFVANAYVDTKGILTVGYGFNLEQKGAKEMLSAVGADYDAIVNSRLSANPIGLTQQQAEALLRNTTMRSVYDCRNAYPGYDGYSPNVKRVLLDLMFNMGPETLSQFKQFNAHIKSGRLKEAANSLLGSDYAKQVGYRAVENAKRLSM